MSKETEKGSPKKKPEYDVGYGKPPTHSQFQKGNKLGKGRKHGSKNMTTMVREVFGIRDRFKLGDKVVKLNTAELALHQTRLGVRRNDPKSIDRALDKYERYGPQEDANGPSPEKVKRDWRSFEKFMAMKRFIDPDDEEKDGGNDDE